MPVARIDVDHSQLDGFVSKLVSSKIKFAVVTYEGPGGGNPCLHVEHPSRDELKAFLLDHYDPGMIDDDFDLYCGVAA